MTFAVIANPKARLFATDRSTLDALYSITSGKGLLVTPTGDEALREELRELMAEDPEIGKERPRFLGVAGGDGTLSRVVDALLDVWEHDRLPDILPLHGGSMNTISKSLGNRGLPAEQLAAVVAGGATHRTRRWTLKVGAKRHGFLFGAGIIPRYIQAYEAGGDTGPRKAATVLADRVWDAIRGGADAEAFFRKTRMDVHVDGRLLPLKEWLLVAVATSDDLGLRFRPFAGLLDNPNTLGFFASASSPVSFASDLLPFRFGRKVRHSLAFHALGREVRLRSPEPILYNLDGELEQAGTELQIGLGPAITFVLPPNARPPRNRLGPS
ncbi:MAG: hypothetical protein H6732_16735 [Alphaproteobacteria bacterium]|nr:hypothetical protein [Alphaproteobacteria bacterium]